MPEQNTDYTPDIGAFADGLRVGEGEEFTFMVDGNGQVTAKSNAVIYGTVVSGEAFGVQGERGMSREIPVITPQGDIRLIFRGGLLVAVRAATPDEVRR